MHTNVEERPSEKELIWLGCLLECEGSIGIYNYGRKGVVSRMEISNTEKIIVERALSIAEKIIGKSIRMKTRIPQPQFGVKTKKRQWSFQLCNLKDVTKFLRVMKDYMIGYKNQLASLMIQYIDSRLINMYNHALTDKEKTILSKIEGIRRGHTPTISTRDDDMVQGS
jgi:hypothetical protein